MVAPPPVSIADLSPSDMAACAKVVAMFVRAFGQWGDSRFDDEAFTRQLIAYGEQPGHFSRAAWLGERAAGWLLAEGPRLSGEFYVHWIGVEPELQRRGVGRALIDDAEALGRARGAVVLSLSTGDDHPDKPMTTIGERDIWADPLGALRDLRALEPHPVDFYRSLGFAVCGVIPDANGIGKPEIILSRPIAPAARG